MRALVVVEQEAAGAGVWTVCTPGLKDLGQANVDVPLGVDCLPLPERDRGHMTEFGEGDRDHSPHWGTADAEIKIPSVSEPKAQRFSL